MASNRIFLTLIVVVSWACLAGLGCSVDSAKSRYILAEKLWTDGDYAASVGEFEKVTQKDSRGKLGLQALFRAAMTQTLYLGQHGEALRKFKSFVDLSRDEAMVWEAQKQIGEILFERTEQFDAAVRHYQAILKSHPSAKESPDFQFRIGRSHFFLWHFSEAIAIYLEIQKKYPGTPWAEKSAYETGLTYFTRGEQQKSPGTSANEAYQEAIDAYQRFLKAYPSSQLAPMAKFGIATCLEELDQLDAAYQQYEAIRSTYPSPQVIDIKLTRIKERKAQRSR